MGAVSFSLDRQLVLAIQQAMPLDMLIETGTFKGDTVAEFQNVFKKIVSIELSDQLVQHASDRFSACDNVVIVHGNSPRILDQLKQEVEHASVLYWLDAHWCVAKGTAGEQSQCPLLDELKAIGTLNLNSIILIDDARLFLSPPPAPHEVSDWPDFQSIVTCLRGLSDSHELMVLNDVIIFAPPHAREQLRAYAQTSGVDWHSAFSALKTDQDLLAELVKKEEVIQELVGKLEQAESLMATTNKISSELEPTTFGKEHKQPDAKQGSAFIRSPADKIKKKDHHFGGLTKKNLEIYTYKKHIQDLEKTIEEQGITVRAYRLAYGRFTPTALIARCIRRTYEIFRPRLGNLNQYRPRSIKTTPCKSHFTLTHPPKISIVTPSYQQGHFIEKTILSVLDQQYPNLEYFIQDGGSQDSTVEVIKKHDKHLSGWISEKDAGQSQAINRGFQHATGDIMAWLNSDDLLMPGALNTVADYFNHHPEIDVVYGNRLLIDTNDLEIGRWILPGHDDRVLSWVDYVPQETLFWRRSLWEKVGGQIDESFRFAMDWDLLIRFREAGAKFAHIPKFLGAFRIHEHQKTSAAIHDIGLQEMSRIRTRVLGSVPSHHEIRKAIFPYLIKHIMVDLKYRIQVRLGWKV